MLALFPRDPDAMVSFGLLAQRLGHDGEAIGVWEKAVQIDPSQKNAHLYLAEALDGKGQPAATIPLYEAFLQMTAAPSKERSGTPGQSISIWIKLADDLAQINQWFDYGQFLRRRAQSQEHSFACYLQAENLLASSAGQELETARKFREQAESSLGGKALLVRKDLAGYPAKALSLTPIAGAAR